MLVTMATFRQRIASIIRSEQRNARLLPLRAMSVVFREIISLRNVLYDRNILKVKRLNCKVISVGNVTVGGTGKTPTVIMLAKLLSEKGYRPAILSRGYRGRTGKRVNVISNGRYVFMGYKEAGDEPALIAKSVNNIPVITGKKRYMTGRYAIEHFGSDVLILDDAFQHRSLGRDIDIVLLDSQRPFGNRWVLPRGELREPMVALKRADILIETTAAGMAEGPGYTLRGKMPPRVGRHISDIPVFRGSRVPIDIVQGFTDTAFSLDYLRGKKIVAFSGIAEPGNFNTSLRSLGADVVSFLSFPDHHIYKSEDIVGLRDEFRNTSAEAIVTTEKDGIKLVDFPEFLREIFMVRIRMEILSSRELFEQIIMDKLQR